MTEALGLRGVPRRLGGDVHHRWSTLCWCPLHADPPPMPYRMKRALFIVTIAGLLTGTAGADAAADGQRVEVKGRLTSGMWIEARRIRLLDAGTGTKIEGAVLSIDTKRRRLEISGLTVVLAADAVIERDGTSSGSVGAVQVGDVVEAKGKWNGRHLDATRVRI